MIIPDKILSQHTVLLGKTRSGKSSTLRLMVEQLLDDNKPVCIIDPKGDWWGLKSSHSGKRAGYPVIIFGGEHADVPLNPHAGAHVAELIATGNRPAIIDLGGWMVGERTRFFIDFASTLFKLTRGPRWLVIDEVHNFAPQGKILDPDAGKMLHWANRLASEGAGKGLTLISASQRPQKVHKDFLTSNETLIAKRVIHPLDRAAIKDWIDGCGDPAKGKEVLDGLASMPRADGWVWSPEIGFGPKLVHFPMFKTYDSFAAPTGHGTRKLKGWAAVDLDEVRSKLSAVVEEAKANDPKLLKTQIADLKKQLSARQPAKLLPPSKDLIAAAEQRGYDRAVRKLKAASAKAAQRDVLMQLDLIAKAFATGNQAIAQAIRDTKAHRPELELPAEPLVTFKMSATREEVEAARRHEQTIVRTFLGTGANSSKPQPPIGSSGGGAHNAGGEVSGGERAVLTAIAQCGDEGASTEWIAVLTDYKTRSRQTFVSRLKARGFVTGGERGAPAVATAEGIAALGSFVPLPTGDALRAYWLDRLTGGEQSVLAYLVDHYPNTITVDAIGEATRFKTRSTQTFISRLVARRLVDRERGAARASECLFG